MILCALSLKSLQCSMFCHPPDCSAAALRGEIHMVWADFCEEQIFVKDTLLACRFRIYLVDGLSPFHHHVNLFLPVCLTFTRSPTIRKIPRKNYFPRFQGLEMSSPWELMSDPFLLFCFYFFKEINCRSSGRTSCVLVVIVWSLEKKKTQSAKKSRK